MQLIINNMVVLEDVITSTNYTSTECELIEKFDELKKESDNEISYYKQFLKKYNAEKSFEDYKNRRKFQKELYRRRTLVYDYSNI